MKLSLAFWQTYKEAPSDAEVISHKLLMRAGLVHKTSSGIYSYLPMAQRSLRKIKSVIREELDKIGAQEITMSVVTPAELWQESQRWDSMGPEMLRFTDRKQTLFCISPTNEESVTDIFRKNVASYKQLPVNLYQINTKFRDEIRPRFGLMRGKEFLMKDAYTFSSDQACLDKQYELYYRAYSKIFSRLGLDFVVVEADPGAMAAGNAKTHEFQIVADAGEDIIVQSADGTYAANIEKAHSKRANLKFRKACDLEKVFTKGLNTCESVARSLGIETYQTLKSLAYKAHYGKKQVYYMIMLLGDDQLNELKLKNLLRADSIMPADQSDLDSLGLVRGYMSSFKVEDSLSIILDEAIDLEKSYVVGANEEDYHLSGFVPSRDILKFKQADVRLASQGDVHPESGEALIFRRGIEVGHIFQLGDKYTKSMKASVLGQDGKRGFPLMGCYGIGVSRTMAAAIEQSHDENGIIWPKEIAPYHVYFGVIGKQKKTLDVADKLYHSLCESGLEVLYDDRGLGPGIMFKDCDLLGLPLRLVLGERDFEESQELEIKLRKSGETIKVRLDEVNAKLHELLKQL